MKRFLWAPQTPLLYVQFQSAMCCFLCLIDLMCNIQWFFSPYGFGLVKFAMCSGLCRQLKGLCIHDSSALGRIMFVLDNWSHCVCVNLFWFSLSTVSWLSNSITACSFISARSKKPMLGYFKDQFRKLKSVWHLRLLKGLFTPKM